MFDFPGVLLHYDRPFQRPVKVIRDDRLGSAVTSMLAGRCTATYVGTHTHTHARTSRSFPGPSLQISLFFLPRHQGHLKHKSFQQKDAGSIKMNNDKSALKRRLFFVCLSLIQVISHSLFPRVSLHCLFLWLQPIAGDTAAERRDEGLKNTG